MANALPAPFKAQDQRSATDQLRSLVVLAHREGLYDAADLIQRFLLQPGSRVTTGEILASIVTPASDDTGTG